MPSFTFGPFTLSTEDRQLLRGGEFVQLTPKALDLLILLVERCGRVTTKDEILARVWPVDKVVEEWNLTQTVYALRSALGDNKKSPAYIETVPRRGYRFVAKVREAGAGAEAPARPAEARPAFRQLTFRRGAVFRARFSPDGNTVFYGAAFEGAKGEIFTTDAAGEAPESHPFGIPDANLLAVSRDGEFAVSLSERTLRGYIRCGTLGRASIFSGAPPREVCEGVQEADFDPAGAEIAVVRESAGKSRLEFPIGRVLYETAGWVGQPRFSPKGELIAFIDHPVPNDDRGSITVVDRGGDLRAVSQDWFSAQGLAWSPDGEEVWFTAAESGNHRTLRAVDMEGRQRVLYSTAAALSLQDVSRDGRVLLVRQNTRIGIVGRAPGEERERDLSWLDWSLARDLSEDGRLLLFTEAGEGGGVSYGVYLRKTDGSPAVRLGPGSALALSPDGRWALSRSAEGAPDLTLLPTGAGVQTRLRGAPLTYQQWACWMPDGGQILFAASAQGRGSQLFLQSLQGGEPRCVTPEVEGVYLTTPKAVSPDGTRVAALGPDARPRLYHLDGTAEEVSGLSPGYIPIRWDAAGRSLFVYGRGELPLKIHLVDVDTGASRPWKELMLPDPAGVVEFLRVLLTADGESYAYTYTRDLSDLYVVTGLT